MNEDLKYYEFFLTGEVKKDTQGNPEKDAEGKIVVIFTRDTVPSKALLDLGLTSNKWFQCEAVEVNVEKDSIKSASGKSWEIGPLVNKGTPVNIFYNTQKEVYKAIVERYRANKFNWIQRPEDGVPIIHLTGWALPGLIVEYETGFPYFVMTRDKVTKALKRLKKNTYTREGKLVEEDVIKTTGTLFLFANEVPAKEAHIKNAIAAVEQDKVPTVASTERKEEIIVAQGPTPTPTTPVAGADPLKI